MLSTIPEHSAVAIDEAMSLAIAAACLFIIMVVAGCAAVPVEAVKQAVDKRRQEQCVCEELGPPMPIIIIVED